MRILKYTALCLALGIFSASAITPSPNSPLKRKAPVNKFLRHQNRNFGGVIPSSAINQKAQTPGEGPRRITAGGTDLYGYIYAFGTAGLYSFNATGTTRLWTDPFYNFDNNYNSVSPCYYRNGKIYAYAELLEYGYSWGLKLYEIDFTTGKLTKTLEEEEWDLPRFINMAYDPSEDAVYGYGYLYENENTAAFFKADAKNPFDFTIIKDYGTASPGFNLQCFSMCYNAMEDKLYGINLNGQLVTIDKKTGNQTFIMNVPSNVSYELYITGMAYSPEEDLYYWNACYDDNVKNPYSDLYTIDLNSKTFTKVDSFSGGEEYGALWVLNSNIDPNSPKKAVLVSSDFDGSALNGTVKYQLPTELMNGNSISGNLDWSLAINGKAEANGTNAVGSTVEIPVTLANAGSYSFSFVTTYNGHSSAANTTNIFVGSDRPKAPTGVTLTEQYMYWAKVTESVNGGYIDTNNIEYLVYLDGQYLGTTKNTNYPITIPDSKPYGECTGYVIAKSGDQVSAPGYSNTILAGGPWQLPVDLYCTEDNLKYVNIIDQNNDGRTWYYVDWGTDYWYSSSVGAGYPQGDDWIILPPIEFPNADAYYSFSIDAKKHAGRDYPGTKMEVVMGPYPNPGIMQEVILESFDPHDRDWTTYTNPMFKVPAPGKWYIGIHVTTDPGMWGCDVSRIRVESNGYDIEGPGECTNVSLEATGKTALEAKVNFTMPTKTLGGQTIPADANLKAVISCGDYKTEVNGKPGETTSGIVSTYQGENVVFLQCFLGEYMGAASQYQIYTGEVVPGLVKNLQGTVSDDMMSMNLTWELPSPWEQYFEGGINPETIWYNIYVYNNLGMAEMYQTPKGATSYTLQLPEGAAQDIYTVGVQSENIAGNNDRWWGVGAIMGTPYKLPMRQNFASGTVKYNPWITYQEDSSTVFWGFVALEDIALDWAGRKDQVLIGLAGEDNMVDEGMMGIPRFSTKDQDDVTVEVSYYAGIEAANMDVLAAINGSQNERLFSWTVTGIDSPDEFKTASGKLPSSMMNQDWVQVYLDAKFGPYHNYAIITEINVYAGKDSGVLMSTDFNGSVAAVAGGIEIRGYDGVGFTIAGLDGIVYSNGTLDGGEKFISLSAGTYIVKTGDKTRKLIVK